MYFISVRRIILLVNKVNIFPSILITVSIILARLLFILLYFGNKKKCLSSADIEHIRKKLSLLALLSLSFFFSWQLCLKKKVHWCHSKKKRNTRHKEKDHLWDQTNAFSLRFFLFFCCFHSMQREKTLHDMCQAVP